MFVPTSAYAVGTELSYLGLLQYRTASVFSVAVWVVTNEDLSSYKYQGVLFSVCQKPLCKM